MRRPLVWMYTFIKLKLKLQLKVADNGRGFQLDDGDELSYGLRNIKERVEEYGWDYTIINSS